MKALNIVEEILSRGQDLIVEVKFGAYEEQIKAAYRLQEAIEYFQGGK